MLCNNSDINNIPTYSAKETISAKQQIECIEMPSEFNPLDYRLIMPTFKYPHIHTIHPKHVTNVNP